MKVQWPIYNKIETPQDTHIQVKCNTSTLAASGALASIFHSPQPLAATPFQSTVHWDGD